MFNRKSISVVTGVDSFNFQEARVQSLTKEIGLVAKDSIVQVGNQNSTNNFVCESTKRAETRKYILQIYTKYIIFRAIIIFFVLTIPIL